MDMWYFSEFEKRKFERANRILQMREIRLTYPPDR